MMTFPGDRHAARGTTVLGSAIAIGTFLIAGFWQPGPVQAHMYGMFSTKAEAEQRAAELKCKGVHAMGNRWMPCANERSLHDALQKAQ